jgi:hypothetical protein
MAITRELKEVWKEDKANLRNAISSLKKNMTDYKVERKSEWKLFKNKFTDDMDNIEKSLEKLKTHHKKNNPLGLIQQEGFTSFR